MATKSTNILAVGATSLIAQETLREFAERQACNFLLVARDEKKLCAFAEDLRARGAQEVETIIGDLVDNDFHKEIVNRAQSSWTKTDIALLSWGSLGDENKAQKDFQEAKRLLVVNGTSYVSLLIELGNYFSLQRSGTIVTLTSVAGDRGRRSNYTYGCAKAMVSSFLSGFRGRMAEYSVNVIDIKPGLVSTPMTAHIPRGKLMADAANVGRGIYRVVERRQALAYVPWFWRWIMLVVKCIPIVIFKRLKF